MRTITLTSLNDLLKNADVKSRVKSELKFIKSTKLIGDDWDKYELLAVTDRTGDKGVLLLQPEDDLYVVQYELSRKIIDAQTGRQRGIICDFCYTWQQGSNAASITFSLAQSKRTIRFLCCGDLLCSQHVRTNTKESLVSRTQLRENLTNEDRIARLKARLNEKITQLELKQVETTT